MRWNNRWHLFRIIALKYAKAKPKSAIVKEHLDSETNRATKKEDY